MIHASIRWSSHRTAVRARVLASSLALALVPACSLAPAGTAEERDRLAEAGAPYEQPIEERELPELPLQPDWQQLLRHAFLANGELEAAWSEWLAALHRIDVVSSWPNTNVMLNFETMLGERGKAWDRSTVGIGFDPMDTLLLPNKLRARGDVALAEARSAGERFRAEKFGLQRRVLETWLDWVLLAERERIGQERLSLLRLARESAAGRVRAGGPQQDLLASALEHDLGENQLRDVSAEERRMRARLNVLVGRQADAPLLPPRELPVPRPAPADDAILAAAAAGNPSLAALAHDEAARQAAIASARLQYLPDVSPFLLATGGGPEVLGLGLTLPATLPAIAASIAEARAALGATQAMARQARLDVDAGVLATLVALHNHDRQVALVEGTLRPTTERLLAAAEASYSTGASRFAEVLAVRRALLDIRLLLAEARVGRERRLAELEELAGVDLETLLPGPEVLP